MCSNTVSVALTGHFVPLRVSRCTRLSRRAPRQLSGLGNRPGRLWLRYGYLIWHELEVAIHLAARLTPLHSDYPDAEVGCEVIW